MQVQGVSTEKETINLIRKTNNVLYVQLTQSGILGGLWINSHIKHGNTCKFFKKWKWKCR